MLNNMELYAYNHTSVKLAKPKPEISFRAGYLPDWFLLEVFLRLPVKCVFRYKCVSKRWLSLISAPSFACLYISRASLLPQQSPWTILANTLRVKGVNFLAQSFMPDLFSDNRLHAAFRTLHFPRLVSPEGERYTILAVSDGLVLFGRDESDNHVTAYHIYNAITGRCVSLPPPSMPFEYVSVGFLTESEGGSLRSYKVVRFDCQFGESYILKFEIFSSETGSWKTIVVHNDQAIEVAWLRRPVALNGNLHWIDRRHGIMAFSPFSDFNQCRIIGLPADIDKQCIDARNNGRPILCDVHQGHLKYIEVSVVPLYPYGFSGFSIWVLDDYDSSSWTLQHRVKVSELLFDDVLISKALTGYIPTPIAVHPLDTNIFYLGFGDTIVSYNMKTLKLDALAIPVDVKDMLQISGWESRDYHKGMPDLSSAFLFMLPPWPMSIPIH